MERIEEATERIDRVWEEAWNDGDLAVVDESMPSDFELHDPATPETISGPEEFKAFVRRYRSAFPDITFTIEDRVVGEDEVVDRYTVRGTHEGEFMGIPPTGNEFETVGIVINEVDDGDVVESHVVYDALGMLVQLGVVEPPAE